MLQTKVDTQCDKRATELSLQRLRQSPYTRCSLWDVVTLFVLCFEYACFTTGRTTPRAWSVHGGAGYTESWLSTVEVGQDSSNLPVSGSSRSSYVGHSCNLRPQRTPLRDGRRRSDKKEKSPCTVKGWLRGLFNGQPVTGNFVRIGRWRYRHLGLLHFRLTIYA